MKDFQDERLKELISESLFEHLEKFDPDQDYAAYLTFCTVGSLIVKYDGIGRLEDYIDQIYKKNGFKKR